MKQSICRKFKHGYCKYGDKCHFRHVKEICNDDNCSVFACEKRHPKNCNFFREYGKCKFTIYCAYKHEKRNSVNDNAGKIKNMEIKLKVMEEKMKETDPTEEFDKKIEAFENKLNTLVTVIEEKDCIISKLEKRLSSMEKASENKCIEIKKSLSNVQENYESLRNKLQKENDQLTCELCEFTTTSIKGLKTHVKRKHTSKFPVQCELCDDELKNKRILKNHMISHTYKSENFVLKCEECDFVGKNDWTMQIHHGKTHSKNIECGLCEYEASDTENLELHLKTCEIYECKSCEHESKQISKMKKHIAENKENCGTSCIYHIKIDRNNESEADYKEYKQSDIF